MLLFQNPYPNPDESVSIRFIPKKAIQPLAPSPTLSSEGWGLFMESGKMVFLKCLGWAFLFASGLLFILGWCIAEDVQGAAGMGSYLVTLHGLTLLLLASK